MSPYGGYEDILEIAELYDNVPRYTSRQDVEFYVELCRKASSGVLELGCGTGRVLIPAAQAGCEVTGLDQSELMLRRCRAKAEQLPPEIRKRVTLIHGDMTKFDLGRTFDLVIVPFRPVQHLISVDEQLRFLHCVRAHLETGGRFVFDVFHPDPKYLVGPVDSEEVQDTPETPLPDGRSMRRTARFLARRRHEQCSDIEISYYLRDPSGETRRLVQRCPLRYFFRFELEHLLARAGFEITVLYGDFDKSLLADESPEIIVVAKKQ
jgi:SAM-dependent methyltransferase